MKPAILFALFVLAAPGAFPVFRAVRDWPTLLGLPFAVLWCFGIVTIGRALIDALTQEKERDF